MAARERRSRCGRAGRGAIETARPIAVASAVTSRRPPGPTPNGCFPMIPRTPRRETPPGPATFQFRQAAPGGGDEPEIHGGAAPPPSLSRVRRQRHGPGRPRASVLGKDQACGTLPGRRRGRGPGDPVGLCPGSNGLARDRPPAIRREFPIYVIGAGSGGTQPPLPPLSFTSAVSGVHRSGEVRPSTSWITPRAREPDSRQRVRRCVSRFASSVRTVGSGLAFGP